MMRTEKEKWVDEAMDSTKGMVPVPANPFLYEKVMFRLQQQQLTDQNTDKAFIYKWAAAVILIVVINGVAMLNTVMSQHKDVGPHDKGIFMELGSQASYNY